MHCEPSIKIQNLSGTGSIALVGHPNVGKSALFHQLTGQRVIVSNYPGTTVEVTRGSARALPGVPLVDTPGVITLPANSEDEKVTERVLLLEPLQAILQVGDAKNLRRTLLLTCQLAEMGVPLVLALNMTDEARLRGIQLDHAGLAGTLGIQIVPTAAIHRQGVDELTLALQQAQISQLQIDYSPEIEQAIARFSAILAATALPQSPPISLRSLALLWLGDDPVIAEWLDSASGRKIAARSYPLCASPCSRRLARPPPGASSQPVSPGSSVWPKLPSWKPAPVRSDGPPGSASSPPTPSGAGSSWPASCTHFIGLWAFLAQACWSTSWRKTCSGR